MKTPLTYYGGKQKLAALIRRLIPDHVLYCEPFCGGAAVFWSKDASKAEVINDTNRQLINFYRQVKNNFPALKERVDATLHCRDDHAKAALIYNHPDLFSDEEQAWAVWVLSAMAFASKLDGSFGYDRKGATAKKVDAKKEEFCDALAARMKRVTIENRDALDVIRTYDSPDTFFYLDPPYFNSACAFYSGYTADDFERLLRCCRDMQGRFLLSSCPSALLTRYTDGGGWSQIRIGQTVSICNDKTKLKPKTEVLTANFPLPRSGLGDGVLM